MKRKIVLTFLALLIFASALAGCDGTAPGEQTSDSNGGSTKAETITLDFLRLGNDEAEKNFWKQVISDYEAEHENIKILYDDAAIGNDMETKLTSLFSGNSGPDIVGHGILSVAGRAEAGHYLPITELYENWADKGDLMEQLLSLGTYHDEVYGLAYMPSPYVFAYRTDLFEEAGIEGPPTTWAELKDYAQRLTVVENGRIVRAGFAFPTSAGNFVEYDVFALGNGGGFVGPDGKPTLNTPENLKALEFIADFVNGVSIPYDSNELNPFMGGNAAMTLIDNVKLSTMFAEGAEYKDKIALALPPSNDGMRQMTFSGCRLLFVGKDTKHKEEAFGFITYAISKKVVLERAQALNVPIVLNSLVEDYAGLAPFNDVRADCVANGVGMPIATWSPLFQTVRNELLQSLLNGAVPANALSDAQAKLEQEIANAE